MSDKDEPSNRHPDGTFKKGYTANPKGPPKKANRIKSDSPFAILTDPRFAAGARGLTPKEETQFITYQAALDGSKRACRRVFQWIAKRHEARVKRAAHENHRPVRRRIELDPNNIDEALLTLGIASLDISDDRPQSAEPSERKRLKLEPWAVQAALARRHGGSRLSGHDIAEINLTARDPGSIRWPRGYKR